jgi:hypothetical protein
LIVGDRLGRWLLDAIYKVAENADILLTNGNLRHRGNPNLTKDGSATAQK